MAVYQPPQSILDLPCFRGKPAHQKLGIVRFIHDSLEDGQPDSRIVKKLTNKKYGFSERAVRQIIDMVLAQEQNINSVITFDGEVGEEKIEHKHESEFPIELLNREYAVDSFLGKGAFGLVALAKATENHPFLARGTKVAIKKMDRIFDSAVGAKRLIRELRVLRLLNDHNCVVKLLDIKIPSDLKTFNSILLVFECVDTDLHSPFKDKIYWTEDQVKSVFKQCLYGLKYMHSRKLVHRDLKPQNILVNYLDDNRLDVKLCDFGLARCITTHNFRKPLVEHTKVVTDVISGLQKSELTGDYVRKLAFKPKMTKHVVTRYYRSPEVSLLLQTREHMPAIDMWSMGCILGELLQMMPENRPRYQNRSVLLKGHSDFKTQLKVMFDLLGKPSPEFIDQIKDAESRAYVESLSDKNPEDFGKIFPSGPEEALDLLRRLLEYDPSHRATVDEALQHPWLEDVEGLDEEGLDREGDPLVFDFEDIPLSRFTIRLLVIDEVCYFNPQLSQDDAINELRQQEQTHSNEAEN